MKWVDKKGRVVDIQFMSNRWLNNIRKKFKGTDKVEPIINELKRRNFNNLI